MFIGASPGSTGGGIKTTTFAVLTLAVLATVRGRPDIVIFRHRLERDRVYKAITVTLFSLALVILVTMILSITENHTFMEVLFEVTSAFTTSGLSLGLTQDLSPFGRILIIAMMFFGRIGPLTLFYAIGPKQARPLYRYAEGKIIIG
jgi:trk system potassium uptake protein TrkH